MARAGRKNRSIFQPGNSVSVTWKARLEEHLGNFSCEYKDSVVGFILSDNKKLLALQSACSMIVNTMPERDPHPDLYYIFADFLSHLKDSTTWLSHYVLFEIELLKNLGFGLDLEKCAATGSSCNLAYVSPKTGRAICAEAGEPYKDKLFKYPNFINNEVAEIAEGLKLTQHFLNEHFFIPHDKTLPSARERLVSRVLA